MKVGRPGGWTDRERGKLLALRAARTKWAAIALALDKSIGGCAGEFKRLRDLERAKSKRVELIERRVDPFIAKVPAGVMRLPAGAAPPTAPGPRVLSLSTLQADAELRARISEQGLTAGLLGDPPAGRSALDQRRAGIVQDVQGVRGVRLAPTITLAPGPHHDRA